MNPRPLRHILCADDDPDMRMILEVALGTIGGWDVEMAADGEETLAAARHRRPDLILLDAQMAGIDDPGAMALLKGDAALRDIPVVFVTGTAGQEDVATLKAHGAAEVITKPFDPTTLPDRIRRVWATLG